MPEPNVHVAEWPSDWIATLRGTFEVSEAIAVVAAAAACFAAWQAFRSAQASRRMYALAVTEQRRTEPAIDLYLVESQINHLQTENRRIYLFRLIVTNRSVVANSIKYVSLSIEFGTLGERLSNVTIPHDAAVAQAAAAREQEVLTIPVSIAPGETLSGIALFSLSEDLLQGAAVESYTVSITDGHDKDVRCEAILLREVGR